MEPKTFTLKAMIQNTIATFGERPALSMVEGEPISYSQLGESIDHVILMLREYGIRKGDRVALLGQNMPNWGIVYFAITSMGAIVVPILVDFHVNEIRQILRHSGSKAIFVSNTHYDKVGYSDLEQDPQIFLLDNLSPVDANLTKDKLAEYLQDTKNVFLRFRNKAMEAVGLFGTEPEEEDVAAIIYTSGTTGNPKGVVLTHKNLVKDTWLTLQIQKVDQYDRLLSILPLSHTYECTIGFLIPMLKGACVYYLDKPPTARILVPAMQKIRPTMMLTVPLIIEKIYKLQIYPQLTANPVMRQLYKFPPDRKSVV